MHWTKKIIFLLVMVILCASLVAQQDHPQERKMSSESPTRDAKSFKKNSSFPKNSTNGFKPKSFPKNNRNDFWNNITTQGKVLASRVALIDAYRNLAETIQGVKITGNTTIKDMITKNDTLRVHFYSIIQGAKIIQPPIFHQQGYVSVEVGIDCKSFSQQFSIPLHTFYKYFPHGKITARGMGIPSSRHFKKSLY